MINNIVNKIEIIEMNMQDTNWRQKDCRFMYEFLSADDKIRQSYTGLIVSQFDPLFGCLGDSADMIYWNDQTTSTTNRNVKTD